MSPLPAEREKAEGGFEPVPVATARQDLPPFAALRAFEATFRLGGVRKAAQSLQIGHAVVSRHLTALEDWFGAPLFLRAGNRLSLNEAGRRYHGKISAILAELALATLELQQGEQEPTLRISSLPGLSVQWLARQLIDFENRHPEYRMALKPTEIPANLHAHEAEVNIVFRRDSDGPLLPDKWLKVHELVRPEQIPIASPELAARIGRCSSAPDFLDFTLLHGSNKSDWRAWLSAKGVQSVDRLPGVLCWHVHMAIAAARMGRGVLLTNRFLVHEELARGELVEVDMANSAPVTLGAYLFIAREDRWSSPAIVALRRFVTDRMRED